MSPDANADDADTGLVLARSLADLIRDDARIAGQARAVIGIAGESGSGKSSSALSLAGLLSAEGRRTAVLHQDDYFLRPPRANHDHRCADLARVGPHEVNLALLSLHVAAFRAGRNGVTAPRADAATDAFLTRVLDFASVAVLIIEGTFVLHLADADVRIFLEATHQETAQRRRHRNRDVDAPIIDDILAIEHELIAPQRALAHIVVDGSFVARRAR